MKSLVILRGLSKKGKLEWCRREGLENFFLSIDSLRKIYYRPELRGNKDYLSRSYDDIIYRVLLEAVCIRMSSGNLLVVDFGEESTGILEELALIFGYTIFWHYDKVPPDYLENPGKYIGKEYILPQREVLKREMEKYGEFDITGKNMVETYSNIEHYFSDTSRILKLKRHDKVLHVSDLHSHFSLLPSLPSFSEFALVVFLGDYIDGPEKFGSRSIINEILTNENKRIIYLEGNHELRLRRYLGWKYLKMRGRKVISDILKSDISQDFMNRTEPEFSDLSENEVYRMLLGMNSVLREFVRYEKCGKLYICTHCGLRWVDQVSPKYIGSVIYSNKNPNMLDSEFSKSYYKEGLISIHGHCKYPDGYKPSKFPGVFNIDPENEDSINYLISNKIWTVKE